MPAELIAQYTFLSWIRRGIGTALGASADDPARAGVTIGATFDSSVPAVGAATPSITLDFYGAQDVAGLDGRAVTRVWPMPGAVNAEPNYFPLIEFNQPDLPWRYTPQPGTGNKVQPWLCLVVLKTKDVNFAPPAPGRALGVLTAPVALLPNLSQSFAWAHTQYAGGETVSGANLAGALNSRPNHFLARILSPYQMEPNTAYTAFLVPALKRGKLAGLGQTLIGGPLDPAWPDGGALVNLPVYYQWSFHAGPAGDFQSLALKIKPHPLPDTAGFRKIDVSQPGFGLNAGRTPIGVEGALQSPRMVAPAWPVADQNAFVAGLVKILNLPFQLLHAVTKTLAVAPPLYGRWPAAQEQVTASSQPWFIQLNEDPRNRAAAGMGTAVVQRDQQSLLAGAWAQVGAVRAANHALMLWQWARTMTGKIYQDAFAPASDELVIARTAPLHRLVTGSPQTIRQLLLESPVSPGLLEPQYRRIARPTGPLGRRQDRLRLNKFNVLGRMNSGAFAPAPPPPTPEKLSTPSAAGKNVMPSWATPDLRRFLAALPYGLLLVLSIVLAVIGVALLVTGAGAVGLGLVAVGVAGAVGTVAARRISTNLETLAALASGTITPEQIKALPVASSFVPFEFAAGSTTPVPMMTTAGPAGENIAAANFRLAAEGLFRRFETPIPARPPLQALDFKIVRSKLQTALAPTRTFAEHARSRLAIDPSAFQLGDDPVGQIMAAPEFPQPMYVPLKQISQEWILPGIEDVVKDSAALAQTNERFIEAYMVGVNHEMARTLLFNEYPTEQRATFFRQFWDSTGYVPQPGEVVKPDDFKDIKPIHTWRATASLGENSSRRPPVAKLVLLVRGELLLRYPNTEVYAAQVVKYPDGTHDLPQSNDTAKHRPYVLHGELDPDIRFFGFEMTLNEALTGGDAGLGYYFVLQQPSGEPLFGFEIKPVVSPTTFKDLAWSQVVPNAALVHSVRYLDLSVASPTVKDLTQTLGASGSVLGMDQGLTAANLAKSSLRWPVRVAFQAKVLVNA
jgi:hypothetical protein